MPLRPSSGEELSLRHLPDASDTSISFQIPAVDKDDYLLADDKSNFFEGVDDSITTPGPLRTPYDALTLSQLSPRPEGPFDFRFTAKSPSKSPSKPRTTARRTPPTTRSKAKVQARVNTVQSPAVSNATSKLQFTIVSQPYQLPSREASPSRERLQNLRAEVDMLTDDLEPPSSLVSQAPPPSPKTSKPKGIGRKSMESKVEKRESSTTSVKSKRTVIEGGITKAKNRTQHPRSSTFKALRSNSTPRPVQQPVVTDAPTPVATKDPQAEPELPSDAMDPFLNVNESNPDISIMSATSGVAGRLMSYGQQFIGSFGYGYGLPASDKLSAPIASDPESAPSLQMEPEEQAGCISESVVASCDLPTEHQDNQERVLTTSEISSHKLEPPIFPTPEEVSENTASCSSSSAITAASTGSEPVPSLSSVPVPPVSPMHPAIKRVRSAAPATTNKKVKTDSFSSSNSVAGSSKVKGEGKETALAPARRVITLRETRSRSSSARGQPNVFGSGSGSSSRSTSRGRPDSRLVQNTVRERRRQAPVNKFGNSQRHERQGVRAGTASMKKASTLHSAPSVPVQVQASVPTNPVSSNASRAEDTQAESGRSDTAVVGAFNPQQAKHDTIAPTKPVLQTRPFEFKFQSDPRIQAQNAQQSHSQLQGDSTKSDDIDKGKSRPLSMFSSESSSAPSQNSKSKSRSMKVNLSSRIPDFKAMHAVHDAGLVHRKENMRPTVPVPIEFATEHRAKERAKFEEHVKEVEMERGREREARRRAREEEEEREIRELRRKAVPKANEVPEWYRDAPKRKEKTSVNGASA